MTRNQFSNETLMERYGPDATFGSVLKDLEDDVEILGEVICGVELNGNKLGEAEEASFHGLPVSEIQSLAVVTGRPHQLASGILENWLQTLPSLRNTAQKMASDIRFEGAIVFGAELADLFDACRYFVDSLALIKGQLSRSGDFNQFAEGWTKEEKALSETMAVIVQAVESGDSNQVADAIETDLCRRLEEWEKVIKELEQKYFRSSNAPLSLGREN